MLNLLKVNETLSDEEVSVAESIIASYSAEFPFRRPIRDGRRRKFQQHCFFIANQSYFHVTH